MPIDDYSIEASKKLGEVKEHYETYDYRHAVAVLTIDYPKLLIEICDVLLQFKVSIEQIKKAGGNESDIPKTFSKMLRPLGWKEEKFVAKFVIEDQTVSSDTHKIDYVKGEVAFDLEWNSKDQTFDRDLYAFRAFFEYGKIGVALLVTRSDSLDHIFRELGTYIDPKTQERKTYLSKYGASTTHFGKLLPRLKAGRSGGCPVLAVGITRKQVTE